MAPKCPTWGLALQSNALNGWLATPQASGYNLGGCWGCVWPSKHSNVVAIYHRRNKGALWGTYTPSIPSKIHLQAMRVVTHLFRQSIWCVGAERKASCGALGGHFRWRRPWFWHLWRPLCFVLRLLKYWKMQKTLKFVVFYRIIFSVTLYCKTY